MCWISQRVQLVFLVNVVSFFPLIRVNLTDFVSSVFARVFCLRKRELIVIECFWQS